MDFFIFKSSNPVHGEIYLIQHHVIKFVSDLRQVGGFLRVFRFPPPIKLRDDFFFSYLTDFSYFPLKIVFPKVAGHDQNRSKMTILKRCVDGFSYVSLISVMQRV